MAGETGGMSRAAKKRAKKKSKNETPSTGDATRDGAKTKDVRPDKPRKDDSEKGIEAPSKLVQKERKRQRLDEKNDLSHDEQENDSDSEIEVDEAEVMKADGGISEVKHKKEKKKTVFNTLQEQVRPPQECKSLLEITNDDALCPALEGLTVQERANCALNFLLQPAGITAKEFYDEYWEQEPLLIQQTTSSQHQHRLDGFLSEASIREMTSQQTMRYGRDLNVTRYEMDKHGVKRRVTLDLIKESDSKYGDNAEEDEEQAFVEADPKAVWKQYDDEGCTIRLLCPHKHCDPIHSLLHLLELEWGCMVGANAYLTPAGASQGFAPHYDDIEAFCLQLEGRKRWKVYAPLSKGETLPRQSSPDFTEEDLKDVKPVMDIVLGPGDILYMPRGWIHQACTLPAGQPTDGHSLHLTVSAMQMWAWVDLMEIILPEALNAATASETSTSLREGLPIRFLDYMGAAHANRDVPEILKRKMEAEDVATTDSKASRMQELQDKFKEEAKTRIMRVAKEAMDLLDASCDQISKQFLSARQPPSLSTKEIKATINGQTRAVKIQPNMLLRLVRPGVARLILEDDKAIVYHCLENSRVYHEKPLSPLEFEMDDGPALEQLLATCEPQWICVNDLFHDTIEDKVGVTQALYDEGILMIRE